jgi:hypothetical protein
MSTTTCHSDLPRETCYTAIVMDGLLQMPFDVPKVLDTGHKAYPKYVESVKDIISQCRARQFGFEIEFKDDYTAIRKFSINK